jgi:hypothetical protein
MAIRIPWSYTPQHEPVAANDVDPEARCEHYSCPKCRVKLTFNKAHDRSAGEDMIHVPAYFKLWPNEVHTVACPFNLTEQFKVIASESEEAGEFLKKEPNARRYRFRLMALPSSGKPEVGPDGEALPPRPQHAKNPDFQLSENKLPAYLSTAKRIFELRSLCESNTGFEEALELIYEGKAISWAEVCFEQGEFQDALEMIKGANGTTHPMALIGRVKGIFETTKGNATFHVLAIHPFRSRRSPEGVVTSVEPRISTSKKFFFEGIAEGDIVIAFGHWSPFQGTDGEDKERGTTFKNHYLYLNPRRKDQIAKAPREPEGAE